VVPSNTKTHIHRAALSTGVFVLGHLLIPGQDARNTYWDPGFILNCAGLGALCSTVYYLTGSLVSVWLVHGVPVAVWLLLLGGAEKLGY